MFRRRRTRRQLAISILTAVGVVTILAVLTGSFERGPLIAGTSLMAAAGLAGIWFFDSGDEWSWLSDLSDYLAIVGMLGLWDTLIDSLLAWVFAIIFYWGTATLVRRARYAR